jgi:hypothetical protein
MTSPPKAPFPGVFHDGDHSPFCIPVKRGLARWGAPLPGRMGKYTPEWGSKAVSACAYFQRLKKVPLKGAKPGTYTKETHEALCWSRRKGHPKEWAFGGYDVKLLNQHVPTPYELVEQAVLDDMEWCIDHAWLIGYDMDRPFDFPDPPPFDRYFRTDCAGWAKSLLRWNGCPSPDGDPDGYGNTRSLVLSPYGEHVGVSLRDAQPLDFCFYGQPEVAGGRAHVSVLRAKLGGVWYSGSHGGEADPRDVRATYRNIVAVRRFPLLP